MRFLPVLFAAAAVASAQSPLTTTFASNNGQSGNMFDVIATNPAGVTITSFDVNITPGTWDLEVYALPSGQPYLPDVNNATPWRLVGAFTGVVSSGSNVATPLPQLCETVYVPAGTTQAFYVTLSNGGTMNYTNGSTTGALYVSNADLEFYEGSGVAYPFNSNFNPRIWNGNIYYDVGNTAASNCAFASVTSYGAGYGAGCGMDSFASAYEIFPAGTTDLGGLVVSGIDTSAGYVIQAAPSAGFPSIPVGAGAITLALGDDNQIDTASVGGTLGVSVGSNGWLALGTGNSNGFVPSAATALGNPAQTIYSWTDLQPNAAASGPVFYEEIGSQAVVTYDGVQLWGTTETAQIQLAFDTATGDWSIEYGLVTGAGPEEWFVGYSPAGSSLDPGASDLSDAGTNPIITSATDVIGLLELAANAPLLGGNWDLTATGVDAVSPAAFFFLGDAGPAVPLPVIGINSPGCDAHLSTVLGSLSGAAAGGTAAVSIAVPANPALAGQQLSCQAVGVTLQFNSLLQTSNGVTGTFGN